MLLVDMLCLTHKISDKLIPPELIGKIAPTRLESINLRGVFRFPVDRYADQILPSRQGAPITGTNG